MACDDGYIAAADLLAENKEKFIYSSGGSSVGGDVSDGDQADMTACRTTGLIRYYHMCEFAPRETICPNTSCRSAVSEGFRRCAAFPIISPPQPGSSSLRSLEAVLECKRKHPKTPGKFEDAFDV